MVVTYLSFRKENLYYFLIGSVKSLNKKKEIKINYNCPKEETMERKLSDHALVSAQ